MKQYLHWIQKHPKWLVFVCMVTILVVSAGATRLELSTNYRMFFSEQNPHLNAFEALQDTYTKNDNVIFLVTPKSGEVFEPEALEAIQDLTQACWQLPYAIRVDSVTNFQHTFAQGDDLIVQDLVEQIPDDKQALKALKKVALNEPALLNRLISGGSSVTGVNVTIQLPGENDVIEVPLVAEAANALKAQFIEKYPSIEFRVSGQVMQNQAFNEASIQDGQTLMPLMFIAIIVGVGLLFKSWVALLLMMIMMIAAIFPALGVAGYLGMSLNTATMASPIMIMTLAVADGVHILNNFFSEYRERSKKWEALKHSLEVNFSPILITTFTTILGFLSLNFSDAPPFRELGNLVAIGMAWAMIFSLLLLPALVMLLPVQPHPTPTKTPAMRHLSDWVLTHRKGLFWGGSLAIVACLAMLPKNQLNDEWVKYFDNSMAFRQQADYLMDNLTGLATLNYSVSADEEYGIAEPEYLKKVESFSSWLREQPEVVHVSTITDVFKKLNQNMHGDDQGYYRLPDSRELASQYLLLYELSLPFGLDLNNQINVDKSATRVQVTLEPMSTNELLDFEREVQAYQRIIFEPHMISKGSSPDVMFAHIGFTNIRSMLVGTTLALILISLTLVFAFRSWRYGALSLLPNLLPAGISFGLWGLYVGEIGLSLSVVTGMTLGIIVDDTIHFMSKYQRARKTKSPEQAIQYAFETVGKALIITSVVLVVGFGLLSFSAFKLNATMGLLTAITIAIALIVDFFYLPTLLVRLKKI